MNILAHDRLHPVRMNWKAYMMKRWYEDLPRRGKLLANMLDLLFCLGAAGGFVSIAEAFMFGSVWTFIPWCAVGVACIWIERILNVKYNKPA